MSVVYVLNKNGKPLMPTTRCGHIRILLKQGKARVVERYPFTIQLLYETEDITQPIFLGIDPGRTNIGMTVISEIGDPLMEVSLTTRNKDIPKLMTARKANRQKHRNYGRRCKKRRRAVANNTTNSKCSDGVFERFLPNYEKPMVLHDIMNKEARFNNRKRPEGWLTPTANHLKQTHINAIKKISSYLPISDVVIELNKFAFMQLDNPNIKAWEYQKGQLFGKGNVKTTVFEEQKGSCLFCSKAIEHYHHVVPKHKGGSDTLPNMVGLCSKHHGLVHTDKSFALRLSRKKEGLNKKYGALSVLNQIIPSLLEELQALFPEHVFIVSGKDTKKYREENQLAKDHYIDAYCIASVVLGNKASKRAVTLLKLMQYRRHDRQACHQENLKRKYFLNGKLVATNRCAAFEQTGVSLKEYREMLQDSLGEYEATKTISRLKVKDHPPIMKDTARAMPGSLFIDSAHKNMVFVLKRTRGKHNGIPDYYVDADDEKHLFKRCTIIQNNSGLRFVG